MLANTVPPYLSCPQISLFDVGRFVNTVPVRVLHYRQGATVEPMCPCVSADDTSSDSPLLSRRKAAKVDEISTSLDEDTKTEVNTSSITSSQPRTPIKLSFGIDRILHESVCRVKEGSTTTRPTPHCGSNSQAHRERSPVRRETSSAHRETFSVVPHQVFDKSEYSWEAYAGSIKHLQQMNFQQIWLPPTLHSEHSPALDRVCLCSTCLGSSLKPRSLWQTVAQQPTSGHFSGGVKRKRSWSRAVFTSLQRKGLEKRFEVQKYVNKPDRRQLAAALGLTDAQVKVWFQNRRMKWRQNQKQTKDNSSRISTGENADIPSTPHLQELSPNNVKEEDE